MPVKLFVTGVTGYVGGDFLYAVRRKHPEWQITALVRTQGNASKVQKEHPNINVILGDNDSSELIEAEATKADIVYHFANAADDLPSAKAIASALTKSGGTWIHTSGTMILTRPNLSYASYGYDDGESFDDWAGIDELVVTMPDAAPHRDIDKIVLATGSDKVKTAIVCPPTIYGPGRGPCNKISMQAYQSAQNMLREKKGFIYGAGRNIWHQIHVQDLSDLFVALGEAAIDRDSLATWNEKGYYLAENGSFAWGDILRAIAKDAYNKGHIPSAEMEIVDAAHAKGKYPLSVGTTSKGKSYRARKLLGWAPFRSSLLEEVPTIVDGEFLTLNT